MHRLLFNVNENKLSIDPQSDSTGISKLWKNNTDVLAEFKFSSEWDDTVKVAKFTRGDTEFTPKVLDHGSVCAIPFEAMNSKFFRLCIIGKSNSKELKTNTIIVNLL